ncbi:MAG: hypothetical protein COW52_11455 [Nitrospirae bacterium CG17_big_fil_post_rev_8_21_14_2_50_50_9]|nr:MAG: hypothetical protein COW52_11455 [Nitrospirae bacterium CG17_big_fil_post_rev_8_21_14_2_50_50_9]
MFFFVRIQYGGIGIFMKNHFRKHFIFFLLAILLNVGIASAAVSQSEADLGKAHQLRKSRKYSDARSCYATIVRSPSASLGIRQEAGYWMGFCDVMNQSFGAAIRDFRWFLAAFPGEGTRFLPDAIYVLARTYEVVGQPAAAAFYYQRCIHTISALSTTFPAKAQIGLARVRGMLDVESRKSRYSPVVSSPASSTPPLAAGFIDPFSKKPLPRGQYQRVKSFMGRIAAGEPIEKAMKALQPADLQLELVNRLIATCRDKVKMKPSSSITSKKKRNK